MSEERAAPGWFASLANPSRFMRYSASLLPWVAGLAALTVAAGLGLGLMAPPERVQGWTALILFIHVPFAWLSMAVYSVMSVSAFGTLVWRHPLADVALKAAAPIGATFTALALLTGSIWGRPTWGTWWVWDGRLTSVFVLFLIYLGIVALTQSSAGNPRGARSAAIVTLVGFINIPIIKFSVDWWNTLHQPASVMRLDGPTMAPVYLYPLLISAIGFTLLFAALHLLAMRNEVMARRIASLRRVAAQQEERPVRPSIIVAESTGPGDTGVTTGAGTNSTTTPARGLS